jgi:hypothetical protein
MADPKTLRQDAAKLRECAKTTREAERQRVFPVLAEHCEKLAAKMEARQPDE